LFKQKSKKHLIKFYSNGMLVPGNFLYFGGARGNSLATSDRVNWLLGLDFLKVEAVIIDVDEDKNIFLKKSS
jgi:hypothetical protein